jgi:phospholipase C
MARSEPRCRGCLDAHASELAAHAGARFAQARSLRDIKHVVVLMQKNRSFDHYFGTLAGVRGFDDPKALTCSQISSKF